MGQGVRVRLLKVGRSVGQGEVMGKGGSGGDVAPIPTPGPRAAEPQPEARPERPSNSGGSDNRSGNAPGGKRRRGDRRGQPREAQPA